MKLNARAKMIKLNSKKPIAVTITFAVVLCVFAFAIRLSYASPKSLYLVADHHTAEFDAWNIAADGTVSYQFDVPLSNATDPAGIGMDESSKTLFITSEAGLAGFELVDAETMTTIGTAPGPYNLAGIDVDDANDIVYTVERGSYGLYVYDWDPSTNTITPISGFNPYNLSGCSAALGIAFDNTTGILWVADGGAGVARAYNVDLATVTVTEDVSKSFTPSVHKPVDITVDRVRGFVYTVSMSYGASVPSGCGSNYLSKYEVATGTETWVDLGHQGVGVAVDEVTGYVYLTTDAYTRTLEVWDTSTWTLLQSSGVGGSPAGICIPPNRGGFQPA